MTSSHRPPVLLVCLILSFAPPAWGFCVGDCNGSGNVDGTEPDKCGEIARGGLPYKACPACDGNMDGEVTEEEHMEAAMNLANGCPPEPTATRTRTPTGARTPTPTLPTSDCVGDCNDDDAVSGEEQGVCDLIRRDELDLETCLACDGDDNGIVTLAEVNQASMNQQLGCPDVSPTVNATHTRTPTRTATGALATQTPSLTATVNTVATATSTPNVTATPTGTATLPATPTTTRTATVTATPVVSTLAFEIGTTDELIPLDDVSGFPPSGVVQIGEELIQVLGHPARHRRRRRRWRSGPGFADRR